MTSASRPPRELTYTLLALDSASLVALVLLATGAAPALWAVILLRVCCALLLASGARASGRSPAVAAGRAVAGLIPVLATGLTLLRSREASSPASG
jgi:hypothetical protein